MLSNYPKSALSNIQAIVLVAMILFTIGVETRECLASSFTTTLEVMAVSPTTTPTSTPPVVRGGTGSSGSVRLEIYGLVVDPLVNRAEVSFKTTIPSRAKIYWGKTADFELGSIAGISYEYAHSLMLSGLEPGTDYVLRVEATNAIGTKVFLDTVFSTGSNFIQSPLANPINFRAAAKETSIDLHWDRPEDYRVTGFRVVRSDTFYPKDQNDGTPIYEGSDTSFRDHEVSLDKKYYYAIFSMDQDGLFSSGALAMARIAIPGEVVVPEENPFASLPPSGLTDPRITALTLSDFEFIQNGKLLSSVRGETIAINGSENLTIRLPYEKAPEILKTIAFTLTDPEDDSKVFPFLLRVNSDKSYYEATIGRLDRSGNYKLDVSILDFQNRGLKKLSGDIRALAFASVADMGESFDPLAIIILTVLAFATLGIYVVRRRLVLGIAYGKAVSVARRKLSGKSGMTRKKVRHLRKPVFGEAETVPNLLDLKKPGIKVKDIQGIVYK